jgi:serine/threonine-protein kinase HSL1, negative regulator of Swe1 kinase
MHRIVSLLSSRFTVKTDDVNLTDLHLKPVHFHAYIYTVLENGRKANLSIAKFTQEKGAASSFYKVVDTLEMVLKERGTMVMEPERQKGIEKSLKDAGL